MKKEQNELIALAALSFLGGVFLTLSMTNSYHREELLKQEENELKNQGHTFIWNDDWESIPAQGYVKIDTIVNNEVYLSPDE
jgi:hypothetical protein